MKTSLRAVAAAVTVAGLLGSAESAMAGCGPGRDSAGMRPMIYRDGSGGALVRTNFGPYTTSEITGLWKVQFIARGNTGSNAPPGALPIPDGTSVDAGYATWHDDGTEIMNSGRAAVSGNFCIGVWKQTGPETFVLNHWGISWIPDYQPGQTQSWSSLAGGVDEAWQVIGPANIQELVTLDNRGNGFSGSFRATQYLNDGSKTPVTDTTGAPVAYVLIGSIIGTRISP
jgi:hypothetical protein